VSGEPPEEVPRFGDGRFEPVAALGEPMKEGSTGGVFLARDRQLGGPCVLKLLDESVVPPEAVARFQAEARVLERLRHPNLVQARAHGRDHGFSWYAMDLLPGGNLQELLRVRGPLPPVHALALGFQVLRAVDVLHHAGLVHRDVKLTNVLLDERGRACLSDLGVAHHPHGEVPFDTRTGQELGTPGYGAPEQWEHAGKVGPAADLFAIGVLVYRLLTRRPPDRLHLAHYRPTLLRDIPEPIRPVLVRSTRVRPDERYPDARAMGEALAQAAARVEEGLDPESWIATFAAPEDEAPWEALERWLDVDPALLPGLDR
jgi:eukaryotic-like serine/threonine-protein kinase